MESLVIRGQSIGEKEIIEIREAIRQDWDKGRVAISRELCRVWNWRQYNGNLKERLGMPYTAQPA